MTLTMLTASLLMLCTAQLAYAQGNVGGVACLDALESERFNCDNKNPCDPRLCSLDTKYPGPWRSWYVQCGQQGECEETKCNKTFVFDPSSQDCIPKNGSHFWGRSDDGSGDDTVEFKNRCDLPKFNCLKRNPCFPTRCTDDVDIYPGIGRGNYVTCENLACQEEFCPVGQTFDESSSQCVGNVGGVACMDALESERFNCDNKNPCDPRLCSLDTKYPGPWRSWYVQCGQQGECEETKCNKTFVFDPSSQDCIPKNGSHFWGRSDDGSGDDTVEFKNRCDLPKFNCLKRNPCFPTRCTDDVDIYPGIGRGNYVTCENLACQEEFCPVGQTFDESSSQCVESNNDDAECSWQEISVPAPVDDCTDEYTFENTKYSERERGWRYLDGFIDCENASEGNTYYVEDRDVTDTAPSDYFVTCHPADGLCFRLKYGAFGDDGWVYYVFDITGPNRRVSPGYALNDEVHSDCVEMDYFDEPAVGFAVADEADCRNKGGKFWYVRPPTYYGSCSGQIPCSVASSSDVTIYEYVCE